MMTLLKRLVTVLVLLGCSLPAFADDMIVETFLDRPETRWRFFADTVMGGVSSGEVRFLSESGAPFARMTGSVSTDNNGGFIQMRTELPSGAPADATGVRIIVRGNDQRYFVHLRTGGTVLPWQYYQGGFDVSGSWAEVRLPFTDFEASGQMLRQVPRASDLTSLGLVAYGRDHTARIDVREVGFY